MKNIIIGVLGTVTLIALYATRKKWLPKARGAAEKVKDVIVDKNGKDVVEHTLPRYYHKVGLAGPTDMPLLDNSGKQMTKWVITMSPAKIRHQIGETLSTKPEDMQASGYTRDPNIAKHTTWSQQTSDEWTA